MRKKIFLGFCALSTAVALVPLFAAFEAHVINVTATIENALNVPLNELTFGTVFPQEKLDQSFDVSLSQSFQGEGRVDDVTYVIRQKPKCGVLEPGTDPVAYSAFLQVTDASDGTFVCPEGSVELPLLCPYLSKHEITTDGQVLQNDPKPDLGPFHGPISDWTLQHSLVFQVAGKLIKSAGDLSDTWNIDLKVPCFTGNCAQDWEKFVHDNGEDGDETPADAYIQPKDREHQLFGCDLWLEVTGISLPGLGCNEQLDLMLVLDRSGSIDSGELTTLKNAANAFITALAPSTAGVHTGQSSFSTAGTLDLHLTDDATAAHAAVNALVSSGRTNLYQGISLAKGELDDLHVPHERPGVKDVMIIITDGNPNEPTSEAIARALAKSEADVARVAGIEIFVVGIGGDVDAAYLQTIADDPAHYFAAANFSDLQTILEGLTQCNEPD